MLWEEQHRYLTEMGKKSADSGSSSSGTSNTRKRKLDEMEESNTGHADDETSSPQSKKSRNTLFSVLHDGIRGIAHRASVALFGAAQWVYNMGASVTGSGGSSTSSSQNKKNAARGSRRAAGTASNRKKKTRDGDVQMTVFRALQDNKYFIGPGDVYGGDYTIYRGGDPSNAHSTATVRVVRQRKITARDLISFSRVQNQVAKSAVLAYLDPESKEAKFVVVNFQTVSDRS